MLIIGFMTCSIISFSIWSCRHFHYVVLIRQWCPHGRLVPSYSTVTWLCRPVSDNQVSFFLTSVSLAVSLWANKIGKALAGVSSQAYPNIMPWPPAPIASMLSSIICFFQRSLTPRAISGDCSPMMSTRRMYHVKTIACRIYIFNSLSDNFGYINITLGSYFSYDHDYSGNCRFAGNRALESCSIMASRIASEILSHILSDALL